MARKVYIPSGAGLSRAELSVLSRLSPKAISIIVDELDEPESIPAVKEILRSRNPEQALAQEIAESTALAIEAVKVARAAGMSDSETDEYLYEGLGKFKLKKISKKITKVVKKIAKPIAKIVKPLAKIQRKITAPLKKVAKKVGGAVQKVAKKIGKPIMPLLKKYGPILLTVMGAFLGPIGVISAALLTTAYAVARKKIEAKKIEKTNKKEAAAMNAEVAAQENQLKADLDKTYSENTGVFEAAGITRDKWDALSFDEKLAVIEKINKGEMPATPDVTQEAADQAGVEPPEGYVDSWKESDWETGLHQTSIYTAFQDAYKTVPDEPGSAADGGPPIAANGGPAAPQGSYELYVEGQKVATGTTLDEMTKAIERSTKVGDRFIVSFNGRSLGLKIRTPGGVVSVPPDQAAKVIAMSPAETQAILARAEEAAKGGGGGGSLWWIAIPAAVALVA
jgi:hypothetical protein